LKLKNDFQNSPCSTPNLYLSMGKMTLHSKIDKTEWKKYLNGQKTNLLFQAGYATGDIPLTHLYNNSPNNITKGDDHAKNYICK
jgi:hypothetical protein